MRRTRHAWFLCCGGAAVEILGSDPASTSTITEVSDQSLIRVAQDTVKAHLLAPGSAEFPRAFLEGDRYIIAPLPGKLRHYTVASYVDAHNAFGALIRIPWGVEIDATDPSNPVAVAAPTPKESDKKFEGLWRE